MADTYPTYVYVLAEMIRMMEYGRDDVPELEYVLNRKLPQAKALANPDSEANLVYRNISVSV